MSAQRNIDLVTNFIRNVQAVSRGETRFKHGPSFLEFAFTSACNLRCVMCSQSDKPKKTTVDVETARPFLEEAFKTVVLWNPSATSEPLLNDVDEMVRLCARNEVFLHLITNGSLLTPEKFEKLAPHILRLALSIDSHVPEVLETVRYPLKYEQVLPNLQYAVRRSAELQIPCIFNSVLTIETLPTYPDFVDWVADMGGRQIEVLELLRDGSTSAPKHDAVAEFGVDRIREMLEPMRERARIRGVDLTLSLPAPLGGIDRNSEHEVRHHPGMIVETFNHLGATESPGFCPQVAHFLKVEPNGDAFPCCRGPRELKLGNVFEQSFDDVWNGEPAQRLRAAMHAGRVPTVCQGCGVREAPMVAAGITPRHPKPGRTWPRIKKAGRALVGRWRKSSNEKQAPRPIEV